MNCIDKNQSHKNQSDKKNPRGIIFTDFDGTLYDREQLIHPENLSALKSARTEGFITSINTGRSLYSFRRVMKKLNLSLSDYFDYLIFSSGAGIIKFSDGSLIEAENLQPEPAFEASKLFFKHGIDFMIQKDVPDNHRFIYIKSNGAVNPDYYRRIAIYKDFAQPLRSGFTEEEKEDENSDLDLIKAACHSGVSQLVAVIPPSAGDDGEYAVKLTAFLRKRLSGCTVIRTTSPIDHKSLWVEIFSPEVSKAKTAARLAECLGLSAAEALAVGNDFNDEDMLQWAGTARTVDEAPAALRQLHPSAGSCTRGAVANAVREYAERIKP